MEKQNILNIEGLYMLRYIFVVKLYIELIHLFKVLLFNQGTNKIKIMVS